MDRARIAEMLRSLGDDLVASKMRAGDIAGMALGSGAGMLLGTGIDSLIPGEGDTFQNLGGIAGVALTPNLLKVAGRKMIEKAPFVERPSPGYQKVEDFRRISF